jgi:DNA repair protein RadC
MATVLSALPKHERPRERLRAVVVEALSERELLALVLRNGRTGESAVDLAGYLLAKFSGLAGLSRALPEELAMVPGIGQAKAASLVAALRLGALAGREVDSPGRCRSPSGQPPSRPQEYVPSRSWHRQSRNGSRRGT